VTDHPGEGAGRRPQLAILGAGPAGLEAALAASEGGFPFTVYEAAREVGGNIRRWAHVRLFTPWSMNVSPRARRALVGAGLPVPNGAECPTGGQLVSGLLEPLATLPALCAHLRLGHRVLEIGREGLTPDQPVEGPERARRRFRVLLLDADGDERVAGADVVLDATGSFGQPNPLGDGGIAAPGERRLAHRIRRFLPDFEAEANDWSDRTVLVVGAGHSAQTAVRDLAELARRFPGTRVIWVIRDAVAELVAVDGDPLPERAALVARARELAEGASHAVRTLRGHVVDTLTERAGRVVVTLRAIATGERHQVDVDRILSLTGGIGDATIYHPLRVARSFAPSRGPMPAVTSEAEAEASVGPGLVVHPEPGYYLLGSKSFGRDASFLMRFGWRQVDEVFARLAREEDD
jgi:hypothetical protein